MGLYSQKATEYFKQGYNCAQSVLLAFAPDLNMDSDTALKLASSFGGGMGRLREVCGAVTSMFAIAGLKYGYTSPTDDIAKQKHYELIQNLANKFRAKHNSIICRELLGIDGEDTPVPEKRTNEYYSKRPCENCIKTACEILEDL